MFYNMKDRPDPAPFPSLNLCLLILGLLDPAYQRNQCLDIELLKPSWPKAQSKSKLLAHLFIEPNTQAEAEAAHEQRAHPVLKIPSC